MEVEEDVATSILLLLSCCVEQEAVAVVDVLPMEEEVSGDEEALFVPGTYLVRRSLKYTLSDI